MMLQWHRLQLGYTQKELGEKIDAPVWLISEVERGKKQSPEIMGKVLEINEPHVSAVDLLQHRYNLGLTLNELSDITSISISHIHNMENGYTLIRRRCYTPIMDITKEDVAAYREQSHSGD